MSKKKLWLKNVSDDWLKENFHNFRQFDIFKYRTLSESFIRQMKDEIDWTCLCQFQTFSIDFMREFEDNITINHMFAQKHFDEKFLTEVVTTLTTRAERWWLLADMCHNQILTENFMERYFADLDWDYVSKYQNFSEDFMRRHKKALHWLPIKERDIKIPEDLKTWVEKRIKEEEQIRPRDGGCYTWI